MDWGIQLGSKRKPSHPPSALAEPARTVTPQRCYQEESSWVICLCKLCFAQGCWTSWSTERRCAALDLGGCCCPLLGCCFLLQVPRGRTLASSQGMTALKFVWSGPVCFSALYLRGKDYRVCCLPGLLSVCIQKPQILIIGGIFQQASVWGVAPALTSKISSVLSLSHAMLKQVS